MKKICIIGSGTYGSYLANAMHKKFPNCSITILEVGNQKIQTEEEIGFKSEVVQGTYKASKLGRYFGLGGTSAKWGGQLLFFSSKDFQGLFKQDKVVAINEKYATTSLQHFFPNLQLPKEEEIANSIFVKKGIWLHFTKRNLFSFFNIATKASIITDAMVTKIHYANNKTEFVKYIKNGKEEILYADFFYVTAGAFQSAEILHNSGYLNIKEATHNFCDHVSVRAFTIHSNKAIIGKHDFSFRFLKKSFLTTRLIGEIDDACFYAQPVFNEKFTFFQVIKNLIYKKQFSLKQFLKVFNQFFYLFPFAYHYFINKKLYIYKSWDLNVDIEINRPNENYIDKENETLKINFSIPNSTTEKLQTAINKVEQLLIQNNVPYSKLQNNVTDIKLEDTYHPYNLFSFKETNHVLNQNTFMFNTGILPRAGGINPTATLFCLIEHHLNSEI